MNFKDMTLEQQNAFVTDFDPSTATLTTLKAVAKHIGIVGADKFRVETRDDLISLITEKIEELYEDKGNESVEAVTPTQEVSTISVVAFGIEEVGEQSLAGLINKFMIRPYDECPLAVRKPGLRFIATVNDEGNLTGYVFERELIHVPVNTPLFDDICKGIVTPVKFATQGQSPEFAALLYKIVQRKFYKDREVGGELREGKIILGDPKGGTFYAAPKKYWEKLFQQPLYGNGFYDKNPHKTWKALCGPSDTVIYHTDKEKLRILLIEEQYCKPHYINQSEDVLGYKYHDGNIICRNLRVRYLSKANLARALEKKQERVPWKYANPVSQLRTIGMTAMKGTLVTDDNLCFKEMVRLGIKEFCDANNVDGFATMDIIKSHKKKWKPGDIIEIDVKKNLRIIRLRMSEWSSSIGAQAVRLDPDSLRLLLAEKHTRDNAELLAKAASTMAIYPIRDIFTNSDVNSKMDDSYSILAKMVLGSIYDDKIGDWVVPSHNERTLKARFLKYYLRNVLKTKVSTYAYYAQVDPELDKMRDDDYLVRLKAAWDKQDNEQKRSMSFDDWCRTPSARKEVRPRFFCYLPNRNHFKMLLSARFNINLGRQPMVGPSNLMGFDVAGFHKGHDCIYVCSMAMAAFYGDQDGDSLTVCPSINVKFPTYIVPPAMKESGKDDSVVVENDDDYFDKVLVPITSQVFRSATAVGMLDNMGRRLVSHRASVGNPCTALERYKMGWYIENAAIKQLKHSGEFAVPEGDPEYQRLAGKHGPLVGYMIFKWGHRDPKSGKVIEPLAVTKSELEYQITRRDIGLNTDILDPGTRKVLVKKSESASFDRLIGHMQKIDFKGKNFGFDDVLEPLKGVKCNINHDSTLRIKSYCQEDWAKVIKKYDAGTYAWNKYEVVKFVNEITRDHSFETASIMKVYGNDPVRRREAFSALNKMFIKLIEDKCISMFGSVTCDDARIYQRHCFLYTGVISIAVKYGSAYISGVFWLFDMQHVVLWFAKRWDDQHRAKGVPPNPHIPFAMEAARLFAKKSEERKQQRALDATYFSNSTEDEEETIY